ncbi:MAG: hypothetical protein PVJ39_13300 [Gammaproteobacteria bacterium]|jgi:hypothetical protein
MFFWYLRLNIVLRLSVVLLFTIVFYGCSRPADQNDGTNVTGGSTFTIPQDGKLTEKQVKYYIAIRKKVIQETKKQKLAKQNYLAEFREHPEYGNEFRYYDEIEKSAARSFDMSYEEYLWVKDTIISAQTTVMVRRYYELNNKIMHLLDKTLKRYDEINAKEQDRQERLKMDGYVKEMKSEMADLRGKIPDPDQQPKALEHNVALIAKYKKELDSLEDQLTRKYSP